MTASAQRGRVLIIAGSDSGGGAGIQADIKTVTALGGYAATAITALTAQNTRGVFGVHDVPADFIVQQIDLVLDDIGADVVKTGMLSKPEAIEAIARALEQRSPRLPLVVDPVMVAKGGHKLLDDAAHAALLGRLIPMAWLVTPNLPEAEALTGLAVNDVDGMIAAGQVLMARGSKAVLVKGGHLVGPRLVDVLITADGVETFEQERIDTTSTHGTGCTLASAIATGLAQDLPVKEAVARARRYVRQAILSAPGFGHGHGPLNHGHTVRPFGATG
ncbi:bifunctional hydroxymethylpyrimidine kinase/phosphomethylpyrimidine kinase [Telmatospirillum sp.]|uniref:bifunctional hydroxymethylpyrimidine kinase/phosphomethylpyrimidine kinase n=1 Tax=Telmatospirillum sp. TaxID=2079197 RepID=UPI00284A2E8F|nr:bifunctional hydroxymethylpyrimidine kinase/phosphomethylpyrimidine kinase [Telmatospirillum sp.]MDR3437948.1 bifunctional hydroxymethylpyrimidine kinase/phosphomethylpyrimidine kinase [Telmatospirillum sp.]